MSSREESGKTSILREITEQGSFSPTIAIGITLLEKGRVPLYATPGAAGADLFAAIGSTITIEPGERALVPTGLKVEIPPGFEIQIRPRSGLALKFGITVLNTPGTIDADYRGEIGVILINHGPSSFVIEAGARIAQLVVTPVVQGLFFVKELSTTERGEGGFGHTGSD